MAPPPDVEVAEGHRGVLPLSEMSDAAVAEAIRTVKAAFLRFFVSLMAKYQARTVHYTTYYGQEVVLALATGSACLWAGGDGGILTMGRR